jgi:hypothetical protein
MTTKIAVYSQFSTRYQPTIRYAALKLAWCMGLTFTVQGLAAATGKPVTSALRRVLNQMTGEGELFSFLAKNQAGRLARYYCAAMTKQMEWSMEEVT